MKCIYINNELNRCNNESNNVFCNCHSNYISNCCEYGHYLLNIIKTLYKIDNKYLAFIHLYNFINLTNIHKLNVNLTNYEQFMIIITNKLFEYIKIFPSSIILLEILNLHKYISEENKSFKSEYLELYKKLIDYHKYGNIIKYEKVLSKMIKIDECTKYFISDSPIENFYTFPIINKINNECFTSIILKYSTKCPHYSILLDILNIDYKDNKYYNLYKKLKVYSKSNNYVKYQSTLIELINIDKFTLDLINKSINYFLDLNIIHKKYLQSVNFYEFPKQPKPVIPSWLLNSKIIKKKNIFVKDDKELIFSKYNINDYIKYKYGKNVNIVKDNDSLKISKNITKKYNNGWIYDNFIDIVVEEYITTLKIYKN